MTLWSVSRGVVFRASYCHCVCNVCLKITCQSSMAAMLVLFILRFGKYACGTALIVLMFILRLTKMVSFRSCLGALTPWIRLTWSFPGRAVSQKCLCLCTCLSGCCVAMCLCCYWIQQCICGTCPNNVSITGHYYRGLWSSGRDGSL